MAEIVVFGGTLEGRKIAEAFEGTKVSVHICVATTYGGTLLPVCPNVQIHTGRMEEKEMEEFLSGLSADFCLDATHPYAQQVTENIRCACARIGLPYIRVRRREEGAAQLSVEAGDRVVYRESVQKAADFLKGTQGNILITTGSRDLEAYTCIPGYRERCTARVLPTTEVMEKCAALGFEGKNLIGMQGPFSEEFNYWMLKQVDAAWMVTKSSGQAGGFPKKCEAALRAGVNILVIGRPAEGGQAEGTARELELSEAVAFVKEQFGISDRRMISLIGMGPGCSALLTQEAAMQLENCDVIIGARRVLEIWPQYQEKPFFPSYKKEEIAAFLNQNIQYRRAALVYSGDIGFYSGAKGMRELLPEFKFCPVSGIASPIYFLNRIGTAWDEVELVSSHGQEVDLLSRIRSCPKVCTLLGEKDTVAQLAAQLLTYGMEDVKITVGERLSYPEERILTGGPEAFIGRRLDSLCVALFENPHLCEKKVGPGIPDSAFVRGRVPMTKEEIRVLSLAKLSLSGNFRLYDIGAGTGSVCVEAALLNDKGHVWAVEKKPEAVELIRANRKRFGAGNLEIVEGTAPDCLDGLPVPTHVFIGGSGGRLMDVIRTVRGKNPAARFVINAVTVETIAQLEEIRKQFPEYAQMEVIQVNVARTRELGAYHLMAAENPVWIACFGGGKEKNDGK